MTVADELTDEMRALIEAQDAHDEPDVATDAEEGEADE